MQCEKYSDPWFQDQNSNDFRSLWKDIYSDFIISVDDNFNGVALTSSSKIVKNDLVIINGQPDQPSKFEHVVQKSFKPTHSLLRVVAIEGESIMYNGQKLKIRKGNCWVNIL